MLMEYRRIVNELNEAFDEFQVLITKEVEKIDDYQLTTQQEIMMLHIIRNQQITANEIATKFGISKSAVSQVLSKLEKLNLIVREWNPQNRRESFITLGEEGKKYATLFKELDDNLIRKYYSKVEIEDLKHVVRTMKDINTIIKQRSSNN